MTHAAEICDQQAAEILAKADVAVAYLFGSRARGDHRETSDLDVAVLTNRRLGLLEREQVAQDLGDVFGVSRVDLVVLDEAMLALRGQVLQEGRLLYSSDESRRVDFEVRTRSEYFDFLPTLSEHADAARADHRARGSSGQCLEAHRHIRGGQWSLAILGRPV